MSEELEATTTSSGPFRIAAMAAALLGLGTAIFFTLRAGENPPRPLLAIFLLWVPSPFILLSVAIWRSRLWPNVVRLTLYSVTIFLLPLSIIIYAFDMRPAGSPSAFLYVIVAPISWLLIAIVLGAAFLIARQGAKAGADH